MTVNNPINANYSLSELANRIIECAQAVHKQIGNGFHEMVYKRPLAFELFIRDIPVKREIDILLNNNEIQAEKMSADFFRQSHRGNLITVYGTVIEFLE